MITEPSSRSVAETVDRLDRFIAERGLTLFRVIDHSGTAAEVGVRGGGEVGRARRRDLVQDHNLEVLTAKQGALAQATIGDPR